MSDEHESTALQPTHAHGTLRPYDSPDAFVAAQRIATSLAASSLVPTEYRGNVPNCLVALELASRLRASPLMVMQSTHVIHGRPFFAASFVAGCIATSGRFGPLQFRLGGEGDDRACTAWTTDRDGNVVEGPTVSIGMARAEGWMDKKGSKWKTLPDLMLRYRAITFFGRIYASDILMGMHTVDEAEDMRLVGSSSTAPPPVVGQRTRPALEVVRPDQDNGTPPPVVGETEAPSNEPEAEPEQTTLEPDEWLESYDKGTNGRTTI